MTSPVDVRASAVSFASPSGLSDSSAISPEPLTIDELECPTTLSGEPKVIEPSNSSSWTAGQPEMATGAAQSVERNGSDTGRQTRQTATMNVSRKKTCILKLDDCHYTIGQ